MNGWILLPTHDHEGMSQPSEPCEVFLSRGEAAFEAESRLVRADVGEYGWEVVEIRLPNLDEAQRLEIELEQGDHLGLLNRGLR